MSNRTGWSWNLRSISSTAKDKRAVSRSRFTCTPVPCSIPDVGQAGVVCFRRGR